MTDKSTDCVVYKGVRKPDYYLYVERTDNLARVPESLLAMMGELQHVMDLQLHEQQQLAQADTQQVMLQLRAHGFYLQMPADENKESLLPQ